jgi:hypothetical protein
MIDSGGVLRVCVNTEKETAGPSATLRSGRDDTFVWDWDVGT